MIITAWKVSKYGVISGPYFLIFGLNTGKYELEITPCLDTFQAANGKRNVLILIYRCLRSSSWTKRSVFIQLQEQNQYPQFWVPGPTHTWAQRLNRSTVQPKFSEILDNNWKIKVAKYRAKELSRSKMVVILSCLALIWRKPVPKGVSWKCAKFQPKLFKRWSWSKFLFVRKNTFSKREDFVYILVLDFVSVNYMKS